MQGLSSVGCLGPAALFARSGDVFAVVDAVAVAVTCCCSDCLLTGSRPVSKRPLPSVYMRLTLISRASATLHVGNGAILHPAGGHYCLALAPPDTTNQRSQPGFETEATNTVPHREMSAACYWLCKKSTLRAACSEVGSTMKPRGDFAMHEQPTRNAAMASRRTHINPSHAHQHLVHHKPQISANNKSCTPVELSECRAKQRKHHNHPCEIIIVATGDSPTAGQAPDEGQYGCTTCLRQI